MKPQNRYLFQMVDIELRYRRLYIGNVGLYHCWKSLSVFHKKDRQDWKFYGHSFLSFAFDSLHHHSDGFMSKRPIKHSLLEPITFLNKIGCLRSYVGRCSRHNKQILSPVKYRNIGFTFNTYLTKVDLTFPWLLALYSNELSESLSPFRNKWVHKAAAKVLFCIHQ